ncbi:LysE family transporter [Ruminococcus sp. OA3]|uniref:LysE family translocator n=1 Tax=Ruminococcus sp. OA3 TaxID=2914164 RepID=UPI001F070293|nr:LysE family transporter [Ruminococcus sp. OA3]MCH1983129.1 LysE family transporter [Ruminococcus sp. OA3]
MGSFILKGIFIGLLFGMPAGAVGAMTAQRTLNYGMRAGLLTGFGSSVADCLYACVGVFGLTLISDFLLRYQSFISLAGGCLILGMGIRVLLAKDSSQQNTSDAAGGIRMFVSSFAVGITNPAAILTFLFAFSWFGIQGQTGLKEGICLVCGVFIGTYLWWGTLSGIVTVWKKKAKNNRFPIMNRIFGTALSIFGAVVLVQHFIN